MKSTTSAALFFLISSFLWAGEPDFRPDFTTAIRYYKTIETSFDTDGDHQLSYRELIEAFHAPYLDNELYNVIRLYLVNFEKLREAITIGISENSLLHTWLSGQTLAYSHERDRHFWEAWLSHPKRISNKDVYRNLFPHGLESIKPDNIIQNEYGDCALIASLAAIANSEAGKRLIFHYVQAADSEGVYIAFPGVPEHSIYLRVDDIKANDKLAHTRYRELKLRYIHTHGLWPGFIETAFARLPKYKHFEYNDDLLSRIESGDMIKLEGIDINLAFSVLTSMPAEPENIQKLTKERFARQLKHILTNNKIAILSRLPIYSFFDTGLIGGVEQNHAYTVLGYDENQQTVYLMNPHGTSNINKNVAAIISNQVNTGLSSNNAYEYVLNDLSYPRPAGLSRMLLEDEARRVIDQHSNDTGVGSSDVQFPAGGNWYISFPDNTSTLNKQFDQKKTGIIEMSLEEVMGSYNMLYYTPCGLSMCNEL